MQIFIAITPGHLSDVVDIQAVAQHFACLNDSRRKQYGCFQSSRP